MRKIVSLLWCLVALSCCNLNGKTAPYNKFVNEIVRASVKEMNEKYGLVCEGHGGIMPNQAEAISLRLISFRHATVEQARKIFIETVQILVDKVNAHEQIRPYLKECPFTWRGADIAIAFLNEDRETTYYLDGSVAMMCFGRGDKIAYQGAKLQTKKGADFIDFDGTVKVGELIEREVFVEILEETYEEALKIVTENKGSTK